jgi:molybdopterin/thiamine biosynthesis adenylyltransferase/rhodanese-related sulfurtransferase
MDEIRPAEAAQLLEGPQAPLLLDVREEGEWNTGHLPGAVHVPLGSVKERIAEVAPDRSRSVITYCAVGQRSLFAARDLEELGYEDVVSLAGGIVEWLQEGLPVESDSTLDPAARERYSRHLLIPEVGEAGQLKLLESRILLIGAGGLGSPAALYLAAAGVGRLGIVDADVVDATNLQRQVLHSTASLGEPKVASARKTLEELNPDVEVISFEERLEAGNVDRILGQGWDVIVDGADNFPTRYLANDAAVWHGLPVVHGSIFRFEGQVTVFKPREGPCYRCLFPQPPPPELAPSCAEGGVLGVLPGVVGTIQATEALKLALVIGEPLVGRLLLFDALGLTFSEVELRRDPACPVCGDEPTITEYIDYAEFCAGAPSSPASTPAGQSPAPPDA